VTFDDLKGPTRMENGHSAQKGNSAGVLPSPDRLLLPKNPGEGLLSAEDWGLVAARLRLSARERDVAKLMFEGKTRLQIARKLKCASGTVRVYIDRLFAKLRVQDRLGMVLRVVRIYRDYLRAN
jgi:DNA-binding NarL/FixJ family response regulator